MPTPTSYQLLKDIHEVTSKLESKLDARLKILEKRQDSVESKVDTMWGKASIGVLVLSVAIGTVVNLAIDWIKGLSK